MTVAVVGIVVLDLPGPSRVRRQDAAMITIKKDAANSASRMVPDDG
jgi:hypothetical protein